jgi:hypothetical protein
LLRLDATRIAKLDRAYETYARARLEQEARIADWQEELRTAQAAATFDERKASQLSGSISGAENKIATAYLKARGEALNALTSQQLIELEKLEAANQRVRDDKYRFLLLSQVEDLWRTPLDPETGQALLSANSSVAAPVQQNYYRNYYAVPPVYNSPVYGYGWNSYGYGYDYVFQAPFYARPNYRWDGNNYSGNDRRDRNARPRWERERSERDSRPSIDFGSQGLRGPEPRRPLNTPQNPSDRGGTGITRPSAPAQSPRVERGPEAPTPPQRERQRESPRPGSSSTGDTPRREQPRPEQPRPEQPRPDPPRREPSNNDAGSRWNRGGGGRSR